MGYREQEGSWLGVPELFNRTIVIDLGEGSLVGEQEIFANIDLTLIDANGRMIESADGELVSQHLMIVSTDDEWVSQQERDENNRIWVSEEEARDGILLTVDEEWVGTLKVSDIGSLGAAESSLWSRTRPAWVAVAHV